MTEIARFFEEIKKKHNIPNNNQLAKFLGMSQNMVHRISEGMSVPGDENCINIAHVTGCDPAYVLALAHKSASKQDDVTKAWDHILRLVPKGMAAAFFLTAAILLGNPAGSAASPTGEKCDEKAQLLYIIRRLLSRWTSKRLTPSRKLCQSHTMIRQWVKAAIPMTAAILLTFLYTMPKDISGDPIDLILRGDPFYRPHFYKRLPNAPPRKFEIAPPMEITPGPKKIYA